MTRPGQGAPRKLDEGRAAGLAAEVLKNPRSLGFKQSNRGGKMVQRRIKSKFGVERTLKTVYNTLRRTGVEKQRPARLYGECDEKAKADFKKKSGQG